MQENPYAGDGHKDRPVMMVGAVRAMGLATALLLMAGLIGALMLRPAKKARPIDVAAAIGTALSDRTAAISATVSVSGLFSGSGKGVRDLSDGEASLELRIKAFGRTVDTRSIVIGGVVYETVPHLPSLVPGKFWIRRDISSLATSTASATPDGLLEDNPAAMLRVLAAQGASVIPVGSSTVNGVQVAVYKVTVDLAQIKRLSAQGQMSPSVSAELSQVSSGQRQQFVYIDHSNRLRRSATVASWIFQGHREQFKEDTDFLRYGVPVTIHVPPAVQVLDYQQWVQILQSRRTQ